MTASRVEVAPLDEEQREIRADACAHDEMVGNRCREHAELLAGETPTVTRSGGRGVRMTPVVAVTGLVDRDGRDAGPFCHVVEHSSRIGNTGERGRGGNGRCDVRLGQQRTPDLLQRNPGGHEVGLRAADLRRLQQTEHTQLGESFPHPLVPAALVVEHRPHVHRDRGVVGEEAAHAFAQELLLGRELEVHGC